MLRISRTVSLRNTCGATFAIVTTKHGVEVLLHFQIATLEYLLTGYLNPSAALPDSSSSFPKPSTPQLQIFEDHDSENIDPSTLDTFSKSSIKSPNTLDSDPSSMNSLRAAHFVLSKATSSLPRNTSKSLAPVAGVKRKASTIDQGQLSLPLSERPIKALRASPKPTTTAPAGRSPVKSKGIGILSRRKVSAKPFTRVDPPSFGAKNGLPFSIDAAISGTLSDNKPKQPKVVAALLDSISSGGPFEIYEDTEDQHEGILMEHKSNLMDYSCSILDISDDESRAAAKDDRGKENVPPLEDLNTSIRSIPTSRNDMMSDDSRAPLSDLNASDYYAPECDASSFFIVPDEGSVDSDKDESNLPDKEAAAVTPIEEIPELEWTQNVNEVAA